jgi:hypothetical protein
MLSLFGPDVSSAMTSLDPFAPKVDSIMLFFAQVEKRNGSLFKT